MQIEQQIESSLLHEEWKLHGNKLWLYIITKKNNWYS